MLEEILSEVKEIVEKHGKRLKALLVFGSSVYNWSRSRDLDLLVIVDNIDNINEKTSIEVELTRSLRRIIRGKPLDIIVFDLEMFRENIEPGGLASGLVAGYIALWDEIGISEIVKEVAGKIARDNIVLIKNGRKLNLSAISKAKTMISRK